jgi:hypothetical protein
MGIVVEPTHEHNVNKLHTYVHGENWHTQKHQHLVRLTLQGEQNVQDKVPPTNSIVDLIALSPPSKRPRTTPKSLIQLMGCALKGKNPLESLPIIPILNQHEIQLGGLRSGEEFENAHSQYLKRVEAEAHEHVTFSWDPLLLLPFKHSLKLFSLVPYMLKKYDWLNNSIDDFKKQIAIYQAFPEGG